MPIPFALLRIQLWPTKKQFFGDTALVTLQDGGLALDAVPTVASFKAAADGGDEASFLCDAPTVDECSEEGYPMLVLREEGGVLLVGFNGDRWSARQSRQARRK